MTFLHLALAASCHFTDAACVQASGIEKHAICGSYLWPASLPKEPMVRRGLTGLTQVGSGVFCTSVFTSGSISEGEGVSLAPAMALSLPPRVLPPAESGQYVSSSCCHNRQPLLSSHSETLADSGGKPHPCPVSLVLLHRGGRGSVSLPAYRITLRRAAACLLLI